MFKKILIANRGEIACRIIKSARKLGIETVAVYSDADRDGLHVEMADEAVAIGPPPAAQSYLLIDKIVDACRQTRAEASGLRLPVRARGLSHRARESGHRLHRP
jgi:propionyl-CoA carboxylase alpha chain